MSVFPSWSTTVLTTSGSPANKAAISVYDAESGENCLIYDSTLVSPTLISNPFVTDKTGTFSFCAAPGEYDVYITGDGVKPSTTRVVLGADPGRLVSVFDYLTDAQIADITSRSGSVDCTAEIRAAMTAARGSILYFPVGVYRITGIDINDNTVSFQGGGRSLNYGTVFKNVSTTNPAITIRSTLAWAYGTHYADFAIQGTNNGANTDDGMAFLNESPIIVERVYVNAVGRHAFRFGDGSHHVDSIIMRDCMAQACKGDGVYGRSLVTAQINAIDIYNCSFSANTGNGINLWGTRINIEGGVVQGNSLNGIYIYGGDIGVSSGATAYNIRNVYTEGNVQGEIVGLNYYNGVGPVANYATHITIDGCYLLHTPNDITGIIKLTGPAGSFKGSCIGRNAFNGAPPQVDMQGSCDAQVEIHPTLEDALTFTAKYPGCDSATIVGAPMLIRTGTPLGVVTPDYTGQILQDNANNCQWRAITLNTAGWEKLGTRTGVQVISYTASMTPSNQLGTIATITATNGTAFTINAVGGSALLGTTQTIKIKNTSGGALGTATWDAAYKMAAWAQPATGFSRSITFFWDGTNWVEISRTTADVPN